ncbi:DUF1491 family protein [Polymorphum gilvum]|uniref:DUF1491 family protein n=1 Tax=Polymorphum gilvum (strain LMG 25793 / CGMCC 1.9160 / SL003B-26A1) TaxID=991905 RepID=F2IV38_POLGS|nr:DUF1491 family protein [Polymorphum gilvum]ADZ71369.1 hypothetical protein SL003B_2946 [Polymorphum gilvum SL003B-26A1]
MRVTSDFFVRALVRRVFGEGGFAAPVRKGAPEAGAIFVVVDRLDGRLDLYGPAPQAYFSETPDGRLFEPLITEGDRAAVDARLAREMRMDPDFWVIEIEDRDGRSFLPLVGEN